MLADSLKEFEGVLRDLLLSETSWRYFLFLKYPVRFKEVLNFRRRLGFTDESISKFSPEFFRFNCFLFSKNFSKLKNFEFMYIKVWNFFRLWPFSFSEGFTGEERFGNFTLIAFPSRLDYRSWYWGW